MFLVLHTAFPQGEQSIFSPLEVELTFVDKHLPK